MIAGPLWEKIRDDFLTASFYNSESHADAIRAGVAGTHAR
jgi:hypothetical protein